MNYAVELFEFAPLILSTSTSTGRNERKSNGWKSKCDVKRRESRIREKKSKETMLGEKNSLVDTQWSPGRRSGSIVKTERVSYRSLSRSFSSQHFSHSSENERCNKNTQIDMLTEHEIHSVVLGVFRHFQQPSRFFALSILCKIHDI